MQNHRRAAPRLKALAIEKKRVISPMFGPDRDLLEVLVSPLAALKVDVARDIDIR